MELYLYSLALCLWQMLGIVAGILQQDHEVRGKEFQQLPFHRIFIMLFIELNAPEQVLDTINFQVFLSFLISVSLLTSNIICPLTRVLSLKLHGCLPLLYVYQKSYL